MKAWKDIIIALVLVMGAWLIGCVMGRHHFREATKMLQRDTTYVYDTIRYSRLDLASNTYELDIPKIDKAEMVFIPESSTTIIYRDSIRYVTLPREYFYTKTEDAEIWHSGVQSTIDSLNVFRKSATIKEKETVIHEPSPWRYSVEVGADYIWSGYRSISPVIGVSLGYKRVTIGAEAGVTLNMDDTSLTPAPYWQIGFRYSLTK